MYICIYILYMYISKFFAYIGCFALFTKINACVCYFLLNFHFFHQMTAFQKLIKIFFISSKKLFSFLRYSKIFSLAFHTIQTQKDKWNLNKRSDKRFNNRTYSLYFLMTIFLRHL